MNLVPLILASTSRYRFELLQRLHLNFEAIAPLANEDQLKQEWLSQSSSHLPRELAETLALAKAQSLTNLFPNQWIIGSDQLIDFEGEILGKAPTAERAFLQLKKLSGNSHQLITSVALVRNNETPIIFTDTTQITIESLSDSEIKTYIALEKPFDCAGSYKIESLGIRLIKNLNTLDPTAIIGLPLIRLSQELRSLGYGLDASKMA